MCNYVGSQGPASKKHPAFHLVGHIRLSAQGGVVNRVDQTSKRLSPLKDLKFVQLRTPDSSGPAGMSGLKRGSHKHPAPHTPHGGRKNYILSLMRMWGSRPDPTPRKLTWNLTGSPKSRSPIRCLGGLCSSEGGGLRASLHAGSKLIVFPRVTTAGPAPKKCVQPCVQSTACQVA